MKKIGLVCLVLLVVLLTAAPAFAQVPPEAYKTGDRPGVNSTFYGNAIGAGLGVGLAIIGAGIGFGKIGSAALESMARQPETAGQVQTAMLIVAALLEGATFFGLIVCILMALKS